MNEKDLALVEKIMSEIRKVRNTSTIVFNANFTKIGKTNLLLLKGLLDVEKESGFFVVLDRPHQYMSYLLNMHGVNEEFLWYVDTATHMSGGAKKEEDNVNFVEGPFHIERLFEAFEAQGEGKSLSSLRSPEKVDFMLIDNIATMLNYNSTENVTNFIKNFQDFVKDHSHMLGGVTIDDGSQPELNEILTEHFDYRIDIKELKKED